MIDELVKVANAMQDAGIKAKSWYPKLKTLPKVTKKTPCVRIWLTDGGHIKNIEKISAEHAASLRKYEPDNGKSLPGFNVRSLYRPVTTDAKKTAKEIEIALKDGRFDWQNLMRPEDEFWEKTRDGLGKCFGSIRKNLEKSCGNKLKEGETLQKLLSAIKHIDLDTFQQEYLDVVRDKIEKGDLPLSLMFYFVTEEKKIKEDNDSRAPVPKFSVFLDVADYKEYPVAHEYTISRLNNLLMAQENDAFQDDGTSEADAYGLDVLEKNDKFPGVSLPVLGGVIIRSQVKAIRAQWRYDQCESDTFPAGSTTRKRVKSALEWITDKNRDGETYGVAGDQELLFAYPRILSKSKIPLAKMLGAQPDANLESERFANLAKSVIEQLKGVGAKAGDGDLEIFSLRKMDKARTKVVYSRNATVSTIESASLAWQEGCQNIPVLNLRDWSGEKSTKTGKSYPVPVESSTVFPIKLHRFLNAVWKRDGTRADTGKTKVAIFQPTDGLRLLLEESCDALATHMMERFMQHAQGYFLTLCRSLGKNEIAKLPDKRYYPGIMGLLLLKLSKRKDSYMKESAFLLGRCLRVADELHRLYCEVVRKKDLPPELCGSSLLLGMMESPGMTLSQLAMRSAPYVKWARGGSNKGDKGGLVWYWLKQWEDIANPLFEKGWPKRLSPDERAQLFLGYLSSFPKKESSDNAESTEANTEGESK